MIPLDDSDGDSLAETRFSDPAPPVHQRRSVDCTPPSDAGDNVVDFASGDRVAREALVLMAKFWQPGRVKTRLATTIGVAAAASLHEMFTQRLTRSLDRSADWRQVRVSPDDRCGELANAISPNWTVAGQGDGDLGQRMWRGFCQCFAAGACRVVMIGADLPTLHQAEIASAFELLTSCDLVLGPAIDGGYYLIGLNRRPEVGCYPPIEMPDEDFHRFQTLFGTLPCETLAWGTSSVLIDTLSIAARCGLSVKQLEVREDVDHWPDLLRLLQRLERSDASDDTSFAVQIRATLNLPKYEP